ncbi:MAG: hypothetical protein ABIF11_08775 [Nitrospirota bacterium]
MPIKHEKCLNPYLKLGQECAEDKCLRCQWYDNDKVRAVADMLLKYCDPRPEFSGLMAKDIAVKILEVLEGK